MRIKGWMLPLLITTALVGIGFLAAAGALASMLLLLAPSEAPAQSGHTFVIEPYAIVDVSQLPPAGPEPMPYRQLPRLPRDPAALESEKAAAEAGAAEGGAIPEEAPGPLNVIVLTNFIGLKLSDGLAIPPDNATAAGPDHILEMVNVKGRIFNKSTGATISTFNLNGAGSFFNTTQDLSDPILRYDPTTNRWFAAIITVDSPLRWILAVSTSNDPTSTWVLYTFNPDPANNNLPDYPNMGISGDKVVLTANGFNALGTIFLGAEFVLFNKAQLMAGVAASMTFFAPDPANFTFRAAQNLSADNDIYMASHSGIGGTTNMRVYTVTGVPGVSAVSSSFVNRTVLALNQPPNAQQSGGAPRIETNDNRLLEAQFRSGHLWTTATVGCTPSGDVSTRACVRIIEVLNPGTTATVNQDFNFGISQTYMYFPAVSITSAGDVIAVFSRSSSSEFAGVWTSGRLTTDPVNTMQAPTLIKAGEAHYNPLFPRWGDYSSAAIDPSDQTKIWVSGEYACPGGCGDGSNWGTWIGQTSIGATPTNTVTGSILINGVAPASKTVKLKQGAVLVATTTTNGSGNYTFTPVSGPYKVHIVGLSGAGTYSGNISINGVGEAGKTVRVSNGGGTTTTGGSGNFSKALVPAGNHGVIIKNVDVP